VIVRLTRKRLIAREIARRAPDPADTQLDRLNRTWARTITEVPRYRTLARSGVVPTKFESLEEFAATVPVTTKDDLRADLDARVSERSGADWWRVSSGTTGTPLPLPAWASERFVARTDQWIARSWVGIDPGMGMELIWGHLHRLGTGLRPRVARAVRGVQDALLSYRRHSAYALSPQNITQVWSALRTSKKPFVVALPSFIEAADRYLPPTDLFLGGSELRVMILTGEALLTRREGLEERLGIPIRFEYGFTEAGVVAHEIGASDYRVLTDSFILEGVPDNAGRLVATITTLYPRCTPLVRYQPGDIIEDATSSDVTSIQSFARVVGRVRPAMRTTTGDLIHAAAINHAVEKAGITERFQVVLDPEERIREILIAEARESPRDLESRLAQTLKQAHAGLEAVPVRRTATLHQTPAGKTPVYFTAMN
jgi:phenylacetate-coenzyme A ligase PaaK-like adenylate-forming protein